MTQFNLYDVSGHQEFIATRQQYYEKTDAVLLVYDCTSKESLRSMSNWAREAKINIDDGCTLVLVETKNDLEDKRLMSREEGRILSRLLQCEFFSVSAATGENLGELMNHVQEKVFYSRMKVESKK